MRFALAAALLVVFGSTPALAQSEDPIPPPPPFVEPPAQAPAPDLADELGEPTAEPYLPSGYRRPSSPEAGNDMRTPVHVVAWGDDDLTLHSRSRGSTRGEPTQERWAPLCTAPCTLRLDPGTYELAISPSGGGPRMADDQPIQIGRERSAIQLQYDHRTGLRSLGWTFFSIGATALGASIVTDVLTGWFIWTLVVGLPIMLPLSIPFFILAFLNDSARVQVIPLDD